MQYISHYPSFLGNILLAADEDGLTGLWFKGRNILHVVWTGIMRKKNADP